MPGVSMAKTYAGRGFREIRERELFAPFFVLKSIKVDKTGAVMYTSVKED